MMKDSEEREWERGGGDDIRIRWRGSGRGRDDDRFGGEGVGEGGMMKDSEEREWERGG